MAKGKLQVAHRMATVVVCDTVAVLEAGRVVEVGQPSALLRSAASAFAAMHAADQTSHNGQK